MPRIVQPAPYQTSFGHIVADVPSGTTLLLVLDGGRRLATAATDGARRVSVDVALPRRDSTLRVVAVMTTGSRRTSQAVGPVYGLPRAARPHGARPRLDEVLGRRVIRLVRTFNGTAAAYVLNLRTGLGAAWNARARFPAASSLKLAIAVEALRTLRGPPSPGSSVDALMRAMITGSDNEAANRLEVLLGGSTSGGSARVNALMRALGLTDTDMYGGYEIDDRRPRPIPVRVDNAPAISHTKYTSAFDLAQLLRDVYLAAGGIGPLLHRVGGLTPAEARYLLYLLLHVTDRGKLDRFLPGGTSVAHKAGWNSVARDDNGIVFWPGGAYVATVMTWAPGGVGTSSDVLAGRIARAALDRFRA